VRILVLSQHFWPENFRINELVHELQAKGVVTEVLTGKPNYPGGVILQGYRAWGCQQENYGRVTVFRVPIAPRSRGGIRLAVNYLSFILSGIIFGAWLLRGRRYDAIFVFATSPILQAIPAIWLGWLKKCPVLLWVQDLWPESLSATGYVTSRGMLKAVEYVVKWIYRKADLLLVQSKAFIPKVQTLADGHPVIYYPNSFLEEMPGTLITPPVCPGFDREFPVLFAGNIGSAQAVQVVLEAAALVCDISDICFVMVGEGSRRAWMMEQASVRGLTNIVFAGSFPVDAMALLMAQAKVLLITLADSEIFRLTVPSKVQAYLAAGRPIVACLNGEGADVILESGSGIVVPAENGIALAEAVRLLYQMPELERARMGVNGRRYFEQNFTHDKLVSELIEHLFQTVHHNQRATV
jgi:glycosyltransferase involved in cell wall biosynthesis